MSNIEKFLDSLVDDNFVKSKELLDQCVKEKIADRISEMVNVIRSNIMEKNGPCKKSEITASAGLRVDDDGYIPKTRELERSRATTVSYTGDMHKRCPKTKSWKLTRKTQFGRPDKKE